MRQYKAIARRNAAPLLAVSALAIAASLAMVYAGYSLAYLFDCCQAQGDRMRALLAAFVYELVVWLGAMGLYYAALLAQARLRQRIRSDLRAMMAEKMIATPCAQWAARDTGNMLSWLTNDAEQLYAQSFATLISAVENAATAAFSLAALLMLSWQVGLTAVILLAVISLAPQIANRPLRRANAAHSAAQETQTEAYKDVVMGASVFRMACVKERIAQRIGSASQVYEQAAFRFSRANTSAQIFVSTVSLIGQVVLTAVTVFAAMTGAATAGAVLSVGNLAGSFFNGVGALMQSVMTARASRPLWEKFEHAQESTENHAPLAGMDAITLENVSFSYGERRVLQGKSCEFRAGGKYAIVGESGSGKSTLMKIVLGLLPGYTGAVRYGEADQRMLDPESLHTHIAYVEQQVYLFADTMRFNITLGRDYSEEAIQSVVRACRLEELVRSLPQGLESRIAENGKNLSGGQRQRIALARALIRGAKYIVLDEGTSALDAQNAREIEAELMARRDLCVIWVTHHLTEETREKMTAVYAL